ncbi:MurR/RpiR family transcriptional regulator [Halomonas sp. McH1-25]|uniref:MurR/RpiR family transcriptional regulator n=1 Tax=unclassified Halomonas TaxID=2609666 RepID=UPI001EF6FD26|nr:MULTISPECIES: MurR/RpiR family transcriptional regulator [unclassified Halomonas]MCG7600605.1 MurR/RpiR family transcriptional regulator [Halomonas sp. McH1-25]MCP1343228.1 MurR/RpiR family transcriptional regulator [Halomonas sp. FL8]MCP1359924.1 MurR/RpiR family transcriptional regulator [Halomonas sp. BBD45]MCP1365649.1 MurR/RpiR family transcriptional regulator [Halomonas sp. BBD48]
MSATPHSTTPANFAELQALATSIRRGDAQAPHLSSKALQLLDALLAMPETVGLSNISRLGERLEVNPSRLTRLAHALGFSGFRSFQALFREDLAGSSFYSTRAERLLDFGQAPEGAVAKGAQDQALWQQEMANLTAAVEGLDSDAMQRAVRLIVEARHVHVIGLRASFGAAHYLAYYLDFLRDAVRHISPLAGVGVEQAQHLTQGDLVIGVAFRPETRASLDYCRFAVDQGATLLALTNHSGSQLASLTEHVLVAPAEGPFFFNPMTSLFLLVELLLSRVAHELGSAAIGSIRQREALIACHNVE